MNAPVQQGIRPLQAADRKAELHDHRAHFDMPSAPPPLDHKLVSSLSRRDGRKNDRVSSLKTASAVRLVTYALDTSRGAFMNLFDEYEPSVEDDDCTTSKTEGVIVSDTKKADGSLRGEKIVELLSDDMSVGTFEASDNDSFREGGMDWETLRDTFEDIPCTIVAALQEESSNIAAAPEDELDWDDDLAFFDDCNDDELGDSVIQPERLLSNTFDDAPLSAFAPQEIQKSETVMAHEDEVAWQDALVSLDGFNYNGLTAGALDGAMFVGIFDDEPSTVSAGPEEEISAFVATPKNDEHSDDQLSVLDFL